MIHIFNRLLLLLLIVCSLPLQGMSNEGLKPQKPTSKCLKPQTLFEYYGVDPRWALPGNRDVINIIRKKVCGNNELWYPTTSLPHASAITSVQFSPDGAQLVTSAYDNSVRVFNEKFGQTKRIKFEKRPYALTFHPVTKQLMCGVERTVHILDVQKGKIAQTLNSVQGTTFKIALDPHGKHLAISMLGMQEIYALDSLQKEAEFERANGYICPVAFHPNGYLVGVAGDTEARVYDLSSEKPFEISKGQQIIAPKIHALAYNPQGTMLAAGCGDGYVRIFDMDCHEICSIASYMPKNDKNFVRIGQIAFNHTGNLLAYVTTHSIATGHNVYLWREGRGKVANLGYDCNISGIAFNPCKNTLAVAHSFGSGGVSVWQEHTLTFEQLLLKYVLKNYLLRCIACNKKPGAPSSKSIKIFAEWMAGWFNLDKESLGKVWNTFPEKLQAYLVTGYIARAKEIARIEESIYEYKKRNEALKLKK